MNQHIPDGESIVQDGKTYVSDDGVLIEIACSYPDMETALAELRNSVNE